jgi:hypothetical protein
MDWRLIYLLIGVLFLAATVRRFQPTTILATTVNYAIALFLWPLVTFMVISMVVISSDFRKEMKEELRTYLTKK